MEKEYFKGQWNQLKGSIKKSWGKLTDDELTQVDGDYDKAVGLIQEKYGLVVSDAKEKVNKMIRNFKENSDGSNDKS